MQNLTNQNYLILFNNQHYFSKSLTQIITQLIQSQHSQISQSTIDFYLHSSIHSSPYTNLIDQFFENNLFTIFEINHQYQTLNSHNGNDLEHSTQQIQNILNQYPQIQHYEFK